MQSVRKDREKLVCVSSSLVFKYIIGNILRAKTEYILFLERMNGLACFYSLDYREHHPFPGAVYNIFYL